MHQLIKTQQCDLKLRQGPSGARTISEDSMASSHRAVHKLLHSDRPTRRALNIPKLESAICVVVNIAKPFRARKDFWQGKGGLKGFASFCWEESGRQRVNSPTASLTHPKKPQNCHPVHPQPKTQNSNTHAKNKPNLRTSRSHLQISRAFSASANSPAPSRACVTVGAEKGRSKETF